MKSKLKLLSKMKETFQRKA